MAERNLRPARRRSNPPKEPLPSSPVEPGAGGVSAADTRQEGPTDMNMHTTVSAAAIATLEPVVQFASWDELHRQYAAAKTACDAYRKETFNPAERAVVEARRKADPGAVSRDEDFQAIEAEYDRLGDAEADIARRLETMPAPDVAALLWKIENMLDGEIGEDQISLLADARRILGARPSGSAEWDAALAHYLASKAANDATPNDAPALVVDQAEEASASAMDRLIEEVPAPNAEALVYKLRLALDRAVGFEEDLFADHRNAIEADLQRLACRPPAPRETLIQAMYRRWEAAQEAYNANDAAHLHNPTGREEGAENMRRERAMQEMLATADGLEHSIMLLEPESLDDVQILLLLADGAIEAADPEHRDFAKTQEAAARAIAAALHYLAKAAPSASWGRAGTYTLQRIDEQHTARMAREFAAGPAGNAAEDSGVDDEPQGDGL